MKVGDDSLIIDGKADIKCGLFLAWCIHFASLLFNLGNSCLGLCTHTDCNTVILTNSEDTAQTENLQS